MKVLSSLLILTILFSASFCFLQKEEEDYQQYLRNLAKKVNENQEKYNWVADEDLSYYEGKTREQVNKFQTGGKSYVKSNKNDIPFEQDHFIAEDIPEHFDAREQWPDCESIREIRNQSSCGSCWAFGAVECFSDRWCIASGQKEQTKMSSENLLSCCDQCGMGCHGGYNPMAWNYFMETGVVTGNNYGETEYCQPYSIPPQYDPHLLNGMSNETNDEYKTPECKYTCNKEFEGGSYKSQLHFTKTNGLIINGDQEAIKTEIMTNGPVEVLFFVYDDFRAYKSGVYKHTGGGLGGGHAVKLLGWGVENGEPYWLCANSWGADWGDHGFFKILRGVDECGIEHEITFGLPDLDRRE